MKTGHYLKNPPKQMKTAKIYCQSGVPKDSKVSAQKLPK